MKPQNVLFSIFALVGTVCFLIWFYFTYRSVQKVMRWEEAPATITQLNTNGYPTISFDYNGKPHEFRESFSSSDMFNGQAVKVHFPSGDPDKAELKSFFSLWFVTLILGIFWVVFGGIGVIGLMLLRRRDQLKQELFIMGRGRKITIPVGEVVHDYSLKVNGRSPYVIVGQWHDKTSNTLHQYKSEYIWYNPAQFLESKKEIDVYIDPNDMKRYYLDISFLPKKV